MLAVQTCEVGVTMHATVASMTTTGYRGSYRYCISEGTILFMLEILWFLLSIHRRTQEFFFGGVIQFI
jgi:hypothetical protein